MDSEHFNQRPRKVDELPLFTPPATPSKKVAALTWYDVPAGTREAECRGCAAPIYWVTTKNDKKCPVDCEVEGGFPPCGPEAGRGVSHFQTCSKAAQFSGQGRRNG